MNAGPFAIKPATPSRGPLPDAVATLIQAKILDGSFAPGERLPAERELATQLRVNRSSVREALLAGVIRLALERASDAELEVGVTSARRAAGLELSDDEFLDALRELPVVFARMTHNRVLLILANSVTRFLDERGLRRDPAELTSERKKLRPLLQRLGVAVSARDAETASRAGRDVLRRLSRLVESGIRA